MTVFRKKRSVYLYLILMLLLSSLPYPSSAASRYKDVNIDHWAYSSIEWAFKEGIVKGNSDGTFAPNRILTEAEFISMLIRYDCSLNKKEITGGASANYRYLKDKNLPLLGFTNSKLRDEPITRGQVARIVAAYSGVDLTMPHAVQYMYRQNLSNGMTGKKDYKDYGVGRSLNRGEAVVFLHQLSKRSICELGGLKNLPTGRDDNQYSLPINFLGDEVVNFPPPVGKPKPPQPPVVAKPFDSRLEDLDIEKTKLIANGVDSTFITLKLQDCYGNPISYDESLTFSASSKSGATISGEYNNNGYYYSASSQTDGPELTVKVRAPQSSTVKQDTISFQFNGSYQSNISMSCYQKPVTVDLTYEPQAELRVEVGNKNLTANGQTTTLTAKIVRPGGQIITDYNGRVRFRSVQGAYLSTQEVYFYNGVATTMLTALSSPFIVKDAISAEIVQTDSRYTTDISSVLNKTHSIEVIYDPGIRVDTTCPRGDLEVAFIIDSSGSMKRNDPERLRVSKSKDLIQKIESNKNIASHFNNRGYLLSSPNLSTPVSYTFDSVMQYGGTNIGEGLDKAFSQFSTSPSSPKVAILLTDGNSSERKALEMVELAKSKKIKIYTIGLGDKKQINESLLQRIASETGGQYFLAEKNTDIGTAYQSILNEVTCGISYPVCTQSSYVFSSPTLEVTSKDFYMNTFINENCADVTRVVLQLQSTDGVIEYELIPRGQNYFALQKEINEIANFYLYKEGTFLAYDNQGQVWKMKVPMRSK